MVYAWFDAGCGRQVYCRVPEKKQGRSDLPCPMLVRDFDEPVQSMADGQWYTSKAALAKSHRDHGFIEIGNEEIRNVAPEADPAKRREDIKHAMHDVLTGNLPPEIAAIE